VTERNEIRINEDITAPEVAVIDTDGLTPLGMPTSEALALARQRKLDLVEVNPQRQPPICKVCDYRNLSDYLKAKAAGESQAGGVRN
jgi:translation initiation factor IF-3